LSADVRGEVGLDKNVLVIRSIHVTYHLKVAEEQRQTAERVHGFHAEYCPIARSIRDCITISTELEMEDL
jgi:organic hydroperoxide reductase OsmC/OhrA